jgi:hypothetical protein
VELGDAAQLDAAAELATDKGIARPSAASVASRSSGWPMMLTQTFAWLRSGAVSTSVTVAKPIRGSSTRGQDRADLLAQSSSIRSVRFVTFA